MPARTVLLSLFSALLIATGLPADESRIDRDRAARYFKEAEQLSRQDGGALWGLPLYGPMLLVHRETREIVANQRAALKSEGQDHAEHFRSALIFRATRHRLFDGAAAEEAALERNEGLAEYTGVALAGRGAEQTLAHLGEKIDGVAELPSLVRSFAYTTGPIYGLLLDRQGSAWRRQITPEVGLGDLLARQLGLTLPEAPERQAEARLARYGGEAIRRAEDERERQRQARLAAYRRRLVDGPVLAIRLQSPKVQFNPNNLQPLGEHGTVYPTLRVADVWGVLDVTGGALLGPSWSRVTVPATGVDAEQAAGKLASDGWALELAAGWTIVPGQRPGDFELRPPAAESE